MCTGINYNGQSRHVIASLTSASDADGTDARQLIIRYDPENDTRSYKAINDFTKLHAYRMSYFEQDSESYIFIVGGQPEFRISSSRKYDHDYKLGYIMSYREQNGGRPKDYGGFCENWMIDSVNLEN